LYPSFGKFLAKPSRPPLHSLTALDVRGVSQTFSAKGFIHQRRSVERSALAIASAILFMPSGRFEPKPA
jgi:hypothetical protein